jgi:hypothetical protein
MTIHYQNAHPKNARKKIMIQIPQTQNIQVMKLIKNVIKKRRRKKNIQALILMMIKRNAIIRKKLLQKFLKLKQSSQDINMSVHSPLLLISQHNLNVTE